MLHFFIPEKMHLQNCVETEYCMYFTYQNGVIKQIVAIEKVVLHSIVTSKESKDFWPGLRQLLISGSVVSLECSSNFSMMPTYN